MNVSTSTQQPRTDHHPGASPSRGAGKRGFTILELIVAMIMLGTVLAIVVPLSKTIAEQRRLAETRRAAMLEISNVLERLTADRSQWPEAGAERSFDLPESLARRLKEPSLVVQSVAVDGPPAGRRFDAALSWIERNGARSAPLRLSAFVFEKEGASP